MKGGGWWSVVTAGRVLSKSGSLGVALMDTEVVRLVCGRVGKYCLADEHLGLSHSWARWSPPQLEHG